MKTVVLIACAASKTPHAAAAQELYCSTLFKNGLEYAKLLKPDDIFILSAMHHLVELDDVLNPYNFTLNDMKSKDIQVWADKVLEQITSKCYDLDNTQFVFLAGDKYRKFLVPNMPHHDVPMKGLGIGYQLQWLQTRIKEIKVK